MLVEYCLLLLTLIFSIVSAQHASFKVQLNYTKLLLAEEDAIFLGGRGVAYKVTFHDHKVTNFTWRTREKDKEECRNAEPLEENCENEIHLLHRRAPNRIMLCGSHGLNPQCAEFNSDTGAMISDSIDANGLAPFGANNRSYPYLSLSDEIFTTFPSEYSSSDEVLIRRHIASGNSMAVKHDTFNRANFIRLFAYKDTVFVFFMELDGVDSKQRTVTRIARLCEKDKGVGRPYLNELSSFIKATTQCTVEGSDVEYNQLIEVADAGSNFVTIFRGSRGSAICLFEKDDLLRRFNNAFAAGRSQKDSSCARATTVDEHAKIRANPLLSLPIIKTAAFRHPSSVTNFESNLETTLIEETFRGTELFVSEESGIIHRLLLNATANSIAHIETISHFRGHKVKALLKRRGTVTGRVRQYIYALLPNALDRYEWKECDFHNNCNDCQQQPQCVWHYGCRWAPHDDRNKSSCFGVLEAKAPAVKPVVDVKPQVRQEEPETPTQSERLRTAPVKCKECPMPEVRNSNTTLAYGWEYWVSVVVSYLLGFSTMNLLRLFCSSSRRAKANDRPSLIEEQR